MEEKPDQTPKLPNDEGPENWRKKLLTSLKGASQKAKAWMGTASTKTRDLSQNIFDREKLKSLLAKIDLQRIKEKIPTEINKKYLQKEYWQNLIQNFDPMATAEWAVRTFQQQQKNISFYGMLATITLSTYFIADLTGILLEGLVPEPPIGRMSRSSGNYRAAKTIEDYRIIYTRNLFNSQGLIPGEEEGQGSLDSGGAPTRTNLPIKLLGTLVFSNELLSVATIEETSSSNTFAMRVDDEIPRKIKVIKIEPRKVTFVNLSSSKKEFIDMPDEGGNVFTAPVAARSTGPGIEKTAPNQFNVSRVEVDKAMADFNNILTQARAVPNFENGVASGYKLFQIVPNSIYDKLGLQNGDVIVGLNGEPINDPGKAFQMLNDLKTANHLELQVKKDGKQSTYVYDIH